NIDKYANESKQMLGSLSTAIGVIAGISLLVGGIGIMNIMLVSVIERTREIGIRKALGASNTDIRIQFIVESIIICIIGGAIGVLVGSGLGAIGGIFIKAAVTPTLSSILIAVGFSMGIGVFFGYYPAGKAAKLNPIDALWYE
ncbi:MAG: ABC transporter permease, partial [Eubacterium aggregans]